MPTKILILYYSAYGHMHRMCEAAKEGAESVDGVVAVLKRVPETLPSEILEATGIAQAQKAFAHIPQATLDDLEEADGILLGIPTRFGNMCAQMRAFLDSTGPLWAKGALVGKPAGIMTSSATQHGGQETTILTAMVTLLHQGMILVGLPYTFAPQTRIDEVSGCSPYGASTITGPQGERMPSKVELDGARYQGKYLASVAKALKEQREKVLEALRTV
ncbi:MAG: NAD(P)H:quinone oxidoreductase [Candidatus Caldatribacterium sp.]|uniref:NAD(P)H:quinone oxidoreductase n=1 Tax=Candidatus Caldatribacterium sp. TaxID=2282143 RepID=UPI00299BD4FB|nr:NAD(P)H:quinone oxidoreductase [Candidatus Caldatribacterium sp.]MCX7730011.1 NAD(P)H:quinone oxidoreductase [Candidatus Caldatribacterium sp.]MDW8081114.1 NAD(P)H:quinone oxidoreductase [Candidatus Calescibacterium sp.]